MFVSPLNDNKGNEVLAEGIQHTYGELMEMACRVEGVVGESPAS
jgi:hypothetical protein